MFEIFSFYEMGYIKLSARIFANIVQRQKEVFIENLNAGMFLYVFIFHQHDFLIKFMNTAVIINRMEKT